MSLITRYPHLIATLLLAITPPALADDPPADAATIAETTSRHTLAIEDRTLAYTATVATIELPEDDERKTARLVYTSYTLDGADPASRPLSFVVNGGPGASSAFLHLGALGPVRLVFGPDGTVPGSASPDGNQPANLAHLQRPRFH